MRLHLRRSKKQIQAKRRRRNSLEKILVFKTREQYLFVQAKLVLSDDEIPFQERNTMDSMFNDFGSYEIYVTSEYENDAKKRLTDAFK